MRAFPRFLLLLLIGLVTGAAGWMPQSVSPERFAIESGSRLWIDGTSTMGDYTCESRHVSGYGRVLDTAVEAEVEVPVRAFDCGIAAMNADFREALRAEEHGTVRFDLHDAEVLSETASAEAWRPLRVLGWLHLAGAERMIAVRAEGRRLADGRVRVRGQHTLRMSDFGVEPPTGLLGLVRAHNTIVVRFDLQAAAQ
ncbi:MAG: YceI family protein [Rhodothermaceae bacterium]|nr:YceI family protein [Rhodothermaceae bacterium]